MREQLSGNTKGLKPSEIKALERIYRRRVPPREVVSHELAQRLGLDVNGERGESARHGSFFPGD